MQSQLSLTEGVAVSQGRLYPELGSCSVPSSPVVFRAKTRSVSPNLLQDSVRSVSSFKHFKHILNTLKLYIYTLSRSNTRRRLGLETQPSTIMYLAPHRGSRSPQTPPRSPKP